MLAPGIILAVACVVFILLVLFGSGFDHPAQLLWPLAGLLVVWVIFLRPCVQMTQAGVVLRNIVRDVRCGWPSVDLIEQRWNLKVYDAQGKGFGSWAITAQRPRRAGRRGGMGSMLGAGFGSRRIEPENLAEVMEARPESAAGVAEQIRAAQLDYAGAVERDPSVRAKEEFAAVPAWPAIGALVLAVIFVVLAIVG